MATLSAKLSELNTASKEGKLLMAALAILTTSGMLIINKQEKNGRQMTPGEMLLEVEQLSIEMYGKPEKEQELLKPTFEGELASVINRFSVENGSNTPDFILADFLKSCLEAFNKTSRAREKWYGKELSI